MEKLKKQVRLCVMLTMVFVFVTSCRAQVVTEKPKTQTNLASAGMVSSIRSMNARRAAHTATLLDNGKVLITGGFVSNGGGLSSVEIFDPASHTFTAAENMTTARASHTATRLPNNLIDFYSCKDAGAAMATPRYVCCEFLQCLPHGCSRC